MPKAVNRCPQCGEPVSPFAAGCAICGYDLVTARRDLEERRQRVPAALRAPSLPRLGDDGLVLAIGLLLAIGSPMIGLIFGALMAWYADSQGQVRRRNFMFVVIAVAALPLFFGYWYLSPLLSGA